ncbi:hypothetical protein AVEN_71401-1 [Araneus ventricosus]|uniref:Uncharacterized protein n=1 Tax=Araneus ventricosus TaxID=182803 RepID=A0A4Y2BKJ7_ARAVE|nr:hypothetical protein AVEN_71401-1 [Araneus ventricosus]
MLACSEVKWEQILFLWMTTPVLTVKPSSTNALKKRILPVWSGRLFPQISARFSLLGRWVATHHRPRWSIPELSIALIREWIDLSQEQLNNLMLSMSRRCTDFLAEVTIQAIDLHKNHILLAFLDETCALRLLQGAFPLFYWVLWSMYHIFCSVPSL